MVGQVFELLRAIDHPRMRLMTVYAREQQGPGNTRVGAQVYNEPSYGAAKHERTKK